MCKTCKRQAVRANYYRNHAHYRAYDARRNKTPERRQQIAAYFERLRARDPQKASVWSAVANALRSGALKREPCMYCGDPHSQAHHHDYTRPLDVRWACFRCHREIEHGHRCARNEYYVTEETRESDAHSQVQAPD